MKHWGSIFLWILVFLFGGCGSENLTGVADKVLIAPVAVAGEDVAIRTDGNVTLSASGSYDKDGSIIAYSWVEDGVVLSTGVELKNYHTKIVGTHKITLTVMDNDELNSSDEVNIVVTLENQRPIANAGPDQQMKVGEKITLDGSGSSDIDGQIIFYDWREKNSTEILSSGVKLKDYSPSTEAIHILVLTVTDNEGLSNSDMVYISVLNNKSPLANAGNDQTIRVGESVTLDGSRSNDLDGNITKD